MRITKWTILCFLCLFVAGCRSAGLPYLPVERVQQRTEFLSGAQQGNEVILSWPAPQRNAPDSSVQSIRRIDVYRLAEKPGAPLALTEDEFAARSTLVGSVTYEQIQTAGDTLTYRDVLELAGQPTRLRYAIRYVNASGQRAAFSNFLSIEPAARIAQAPTLSAQPKIAEDAITLSWLPPTAKHRRFNAREPARLQRVPDRRVGTQPGNQPPNSALISTTEYVDKNFLFGKDYRYVVRTVSSEQVARRWRVSTPTLFLRHREISFHPLRLKDRVLLRLNQPPQDSRFSSPRTKRRDIAGYNIYRSTDPNLPKQDWTKLNQTLLTRTTFQDDRVEAGKTYYYYIVAVDKVWKCQPAFRSRIGTGALNEMKLCRIARWARSTSLCWNVRFKCLPSTGGLQF